MPTSSDSATDQSNRSADPKTAQSSDREWAAFTEVGPWEVRRSEVRWTGLAVTLRTAAQAEVPHLTKPSKLPPGARVLAVSGQLGRAVLPWLVRKKRGAYADADASQAEISRRLREAAEYLGPTYIKLGQIISSGEGLFPAHLVEEFKK
jgi:ubiquinone biosynthesis protein